MSRSLPNPRAIRQSLRTDIEWLIEKGVKTIFHPCVFYERKELPDAQNHFNCPIVASYAENLKNNVELVFDGTVQYIRTFIAFTNEKRRQTAWSGYAKRNGISPKRKSAPPSRLPMRNS